MNKQSNRSSLLFAIVLGVILRVALVHFGFFETFSNRVEISTPINSFKRGLGVCFVLL